MAFTNTRHPNFYNVYAGHYQRLEYCSPVRRITEVRFFHGALMLSCGAELMVERLGADSRSVYFNLLVRLQDKRPVNHEAGAQC